MEELRPTPLFDPKGALPHGLVYRPEFISRAEEAALLESIAPLPFREARFQQYFARRRVVHFHPAGITTAYDSSAEDTFSSGPLPPFLHALAQKVGEALSVDPATFVHALVSEYRPGTPIGWHRDKAAYGVVIGLSLAGWGRMRFRPIASLPPHRDMFLLALEPRSLYMMQGPIRWQWQHSMLPTKSLRYSITFRTRADAS
jgi:alkylated DNA repair dioxygenase AlkB